MSMYHLRLAIAVAAALVPSLAWAQHQEHQPSQAASAELSQCLRVQPTIDNITSAAMTRAEAARLQNSPADLRAAVDHLEAALRDVRAQLAPCAAAAASTDPHAGHTMPSAAPASKSTAPSKPPAPKPEGGKAVDSHAGHSSAKPADKQRDPVNGLMVDPATAPKATYQGQTYYFSSEQSQKEFLENPAKFAKKPNM